MLSPIRVVFKPVPSVDDLPRIFTPFLQRNQVSHPLDGFRINPVKIGLATTGGLLDSGLCGFDTYQSKKNT